MLAKDFSYALKPSQVVAIFVHLVNTASISWQLCWDSTSIYTMKMVHIQLMKLATCVLCGVCVCVCVCERECVCLLMCV